MTPASKRAAVAFTARRLGVRYPGRRAPALDEIDLEIGPGERVLLAGPSGSGKSTLALALAGLIPRSVEAETRGTIRVDGVDAQDLPPGAVAERVGIVFQDPAAQFTMPIVEDEVAFGLENLGWPPAAMARSVEAALGAVGLLERRAWPLDRLSGGQQQRVVLAATLAMATGAIVLDEPAAHLDPRAMDALYDWVRRLAGDGERTVIAVEHALDRSIAGLVDRCLVLDGSGHVALDGSIGSVFGTTDGARRCRRLGVWLPAPVRLALLLDATDPLPLDIEAAATRIAAEAVWSERLREAAALTERRPRPPLGPPVLEAVGLTVRHRSPGRTHLALRHASVTVRAGELVALVGANGSGKTTLLRAVSGLIPLDGGAVRVAGSDTATSGAQPHLVGHVFQNPEAGFVADTVHDEVAFGPRAAGWSEADVDRETQRILERFGLVELAPANPFTLSQGQKRRLSIAAALIVRPRLLVLDEPTFGQDARSAAALLDEIAAIRADGTAVLVATHDIELVAEVADSIVALEGGATLGQWASAEYLADDALLAATAQVRPPLMRMLATARSRGADVPERLRWMDLEPAVSLAPSFALAGASCQPRAGGPR